MTGIEQAAVAALRGALLSHTDRLTLTRLPAGDRAVDLELPAPSGAVNADGVPELDPDYVAAIQREVSAIGRLPRTVAFAGGPMVVVGASLVDAAERAGEALPSPGDSAVGRSRADVVRGRVAVVTGGAQGFGEEIVRHLVADGALVFIADLNLDGAERLAAELSAAHGPVVRAAAVDVSREESVEALLASVVDHAGGLDLFVSNAGVLKAGSVKAMTGPDFDFVTRVNYNGFFLCAKHASRVMAAQNVVAPANRWTDIVQINSKSGLVGSNRNGAYAGSKFGGIGLVQSFALELIADRIKVNAICPGNFFEGPLWSDPDRGLFVQYLNAGKVVGAKTIADVKAYYESRVPMGRGCRGEDVMRAMYYIVEQLYETGQAVPVTGGQNMLA